MKKIKIIFLVIYTITIVTWLCVRVEILEAEKDSTTIIEMLDLMKDDQDIVIKDTESLEVLYKGHVRDCNEEFFDYTVNYVHSSAQGINIMIEK